MKCKAKVIYTKKGKIFQTINPLATEQEIEYFVNSIGAKHLEKVNLYAENGQMYECQGKVVATIEAQDEPYFGSSSASLNIDYKCDTCGHTYYPQLPDAYHINDWFNTQLDKMD